MPKEPTLDDLLKQAGRLQNQLSQYALRSHQTAIKDRKKALPVEKVLPKAKLPVVKKKPVPEHLKPYLFKKKSK